MQLQASFGESTFAQEVDLTGFTDVSVRLNYTTIDCNDIFGSGVSTVHLDVESIGGTQLFTQQFGTCDGPTALVTEDLGQPAVIDIGDVADGPVRIKLRIVANSLWFIRFQSVELVIP